MGQLFLKDIKVTKNYLVLFALFITVTYVFHVNSVGISMMIMLGFLVLLFYFDHHNGVFRSLVSFPLTRKQIVLARFSFIYTFTLLFMLLIWLMDSIAYSTFPVLGNYTYLTGLDIVHNTAIVTLLMAIYLPIFFAFSNFIKAMTVFMITHVIIIYTYNVTLGNPYITLDDKISSWIDPILNIQPYLIPLLFSLVAMVLSYYISVSLFSKRDVE